MKKILAALTLLIIVSCQPQKSTYRTIDGFAEGTTYHIIYSDSLNRDLSEQITEYFARFENSLSIYDPNSLVSRINNGDTLAIPDAWFVECFKLSQQISRQTDGLFDITLRPLIAAYGFGGKQQMKNISASDIDSMLQFVGYEKISLENGNIIKADPRVELDFNAIAKGFSVDVLGCLFDSLGIRNYLIEVGGEIFCRGKNSKGTDWKIAIDAPFEGNYSPGADTRATLYMNSKGLATSGNYRKFMINEQGDKVVHTIDPKTGKPSIHNLLSATIIAPTCAEADGLATACMVGGFERAKNLVENLPDVEALLIYSEGDDMMVYMTENMKSRVIAVSNQ